jgi:hypothetical protein
MMKKVKRIMNAPPVRIWVSRHAEISSRRTILEMIPLKAKRKAPKNR